jgi:hypothetical protein
MAQAGKPSSFLSGTFDCYVWPPKIIYIFYIYYGNREYHTEINNRISVSCFSTWLGRVCFCWMVVTTTPKKVTFWKEIASWCHQTWFARKSSMILSARSLHLVWVFPIARFDYQRASGTFRSCFNFWVVLLTSNRSFSDNVKQFLTNCKNLVLTELSSLLVMILILKLNNLTWQRKITNL